MFNKHVGEKYYPLFYQKADSDFICNGGRLLVTDCEYIVTYFLKTVMRFSKENTTVTKISEASYPLLYGKGLCLSDDVQSIRLYFTSKTADKVYRSFGLE